jgi:uncharacterized protein (DUF2235 family)
MRPDELEKQWRERLDALGPAPRAELLHVLMLPDFERADRIGEFWRPQSRAFAELLIDCEEDRTASTYARASTRARSRSTGTTSPVSPYTSARASRRRLVRVRSLCRERSSTSSRAAGSPSRTPGSTY